MNAVTTPDLEKRYVLWAGRVLGIFLGEFPEFGYRWSHACPGEVTEAPTYTEEEAKEQVRKIAAKGIQDQITLKLVWPSRGTKATVADCNNAALPAWGRLA